MRLISEVRYSFEHVRSKRFDMFLLNVLLAASVCGGIFTASVRERRYHREASPRVGNVRVGAVDDAESTPLFWAEEARRGIAAFEARAGAEDARTAKNLVLFLGDGMSIPTLTAARTLLGQRQNRTGEESQLAFEAFPSVGLSKTYCVNQQIADSACSATAYLCGVKANYGTIGVTAKVPRHDCAASQDKSTYVNSIASWALEAGLDVGIVTTTRITHASPAGTYAHTANRDWESDADVLENGQDVARCPDIAEQLINSYPGNQFKVILGGGRREFLSSNLKSEFGEPGRRIDGRDLTTEWEERQRLNNNSWARVWDRSTLAMALEQQPDYLLGLFADSHLVYKELAPDTQPTLAELTEAAIRQLSRSPRGFFLFVEGGRIDHAHHDNQPALALSETIELSEAVGRAQSLLDEKESLVVVTSDHAHVMSLNGYSARGNNILGVSDQQDDDGIPYMTLSYANGPGFRPHNINSREDITKYDYENVEFMYEAAVPLDSETHGGDDVGVFAWGAQHAAFSGLYEQSRIPRLMAYSACIGDGPHAPSCTNTIKHN